MNRLILIIAVVCALFAQWSCTKDQLIIAEAESTQIKGPLPTSESAFLNPLYIPPVVRPAGLTLTAAPGVTDMGSGILSTAWTYNGSFPGPSIIASRGDEASIVFQNNLAQTSIIHGHGLIVGTEDDGQPQQAVGPGLSYAYQYGINQRASMNWYHPHPHGLTGEQVYMGLAGAYIIRDDEERALRLPAYEFEVPLILRDAKFSGSGDLSFSSGGGNTPMVNGTIDPYLEVKRAVYRFRILNGSNANYFRLELTGTPPDMEKPFILIGNDGGLLPASSRESEITLGGAERIDVLIDFRGIADGTDIVLHDKEQGWDFLEFRVRGTDVVPYSGPLAISSKVEPLVAPAGATSRTFSFDGSGKINGQSFDMNRIDWTVPFAETEIWHLTTGGTGPHPVHIHGVPFQIISRTGGRGTVYPWEKGWKDTALLLDNETVTILIRFDEFSGRYLMHCHKLSHEDAGMMANFEVLPAP